MVSISATLSTLYRVATAVVATTVVMAPEWHAYLVQVQVVLVEGESLVPVATRKRVPVVVEDCPWQARVAVAVAGRVGEVALHTVDLVVVSVARVVVA